MPDAKDPTSVNGAQRWLSSGCPNVIASVQESGARPKLFAVPGVCARKMRASLREFRDSVLSLSMPNLADAIDVTMIYYEKKGDGITFEIPDDDPSTLF